MRIRYRSAVDKFMFVSCQMTDSSPVVFVVSGENNCVSIIVHVMRLTTIKTTFFDSNNKTSARHVSFNTSNQRVFFLRLSKRRQSNSLLGY